MKRIYNVFIGQSLTIFSAKTVAAAAAEARSK